MKPTKKIMPICIAAALAIPSLILTGCGNPDNTESGSKTDPYDCSGAKLTLETVDVAGKSFTGSADNTIWKSENDTFGIQGAFTAERDITIADYKMCKYEVTKAQYKAIMSDTTLNELSLDADPSLTTSDSEKYRIATGEINGDRPVENVTWFDAVYFCNLQSKKDGIKEAYTITNPGVTDGHITSATVECDFSKTGWRLPTQVEWEFAARGGDPDAAEWKYEYAGADSPFADKYAMKAANDISANLDSSVDAVGWYCYNSTSETGETSTSSVQSYVPGNCPHQCGLKSANKLGIYDMTGNVCEWCYDYRSDLYSSTDVTADTPLTGDRSGKYKVICGGSFSQNAYEQSVAETAVYEPGKKNPDSAIMLTGFRMVRTK